MQHKQLWDKRFWFYKSGLAEEILLQKFIAFFKLCYHAEGPVATVLSGGKNLFSAFHFLKGH